MDIKLIILADIALMAVVVALVMDPIAQDPAYHQFADQQTYFGIPNFWNVVSNLPLALAGAVGIGLVVRGGCGFLNALRPIYFTFFCGALLTGFGSAYYHLDPTNWTLVWDRLPMTLLFVAFFAAVWGEHISVAMARRMIWPLVGLGFASVIYWIGTENSGQGDLRAYIVVQFLPLILIPLILLLFPSKLAPVHYLWAVLALYLVAKVAELLDEPIYNLTGGFSGHTVKHLVAAAGVFLFALAGRRRSIGSIDRHA